MALPPLPIDPLLPSIVDAVRSRGAVVLQAAAGAGKTTRVPRALLDAGAFEDELWVLEPRRLATRLAAARVSEELEEPLGRTVGYQIRFDEVASRATRVRFVTEGLLTRRLLSDPELRGVGAVILDEFHERHLPADLGLALLRRLRERRPALRLVVMSATLDPGPVARFLGDAPVLTSEGRLFPVEIEHLAAPDPRPLEAQVLAAVKRLASRASEADGHLLVFLPGAAEIRRAEEACREYAGRHGLRILPLHGDLGADEQDRAVRPSRDRKLILSTNVAETSVTVEGVSAVIDSGLARMATHSPWSGLPSLRIQPISRASAAQRAGRAGRTRAGICLRLYTRTDLDQRRERDAPEVARSDLAETVLALAAAGIPDARSFGWFEAPPAAALEAAEALLSELGARAKDGSLTETGRRLLAFPVHPRLGRILLEGERRGVPREAARAAALLSERPSRSGARLGEARRPGRAVSGRSDVLEQLEELGADRRSSGARNVGRTAAQLVRGLRPSEHAPPAGREDALLLSLLAGFPDRVARRRRAHGPELVLAGGGSAVLDPSSVVQESMLLVALEAEQRTGPRGPEVRVRMASEVEPEWLLELFPERLSDEDRLVFSEEAGRVERLTRLGYGAVSLEERRTVAERSEAAEALLAGVLRARGVETVTDAERLASFRARLELARRLFPAEPWPAVDDEAMAGLLARGRRSLAEVREADPVQEILGALDPGAAQRLARELPERVALPGGRSVRVHYTSGQPPWIASRLQDFFGLQEGPSLAHGRLPLVLHLLAPNQRAVQVTQDLAGFWSRHYPSLRRELGRRYPRHSWPEDPLRAAPAAARRR